MVKKNEKYRLPVSREQIGLWLVHELKAESSAYNIAGIIEFNGKLDLSVLQNSINEIVNRHEALRTYMECKEDKVYQVVYHGLEIPMDLIDFYSDGNLSQGVDKKWEELLEKESARVFHLDEAPLAHFTLVKFDENINRLVIVLHHIIADGWSVKILIDDLIASYLALSAGKPCDLEALKIQLGDYAAWQEENLSDHKYDDIMNYWKNKFQIPVEALELPVDFNHNGADEDQAEYYEDLIDINLGNAIKAYCKEHQITLFMFMIAGYSVLISKFSRKKDIAINTPVANRPFQELENVVGYFVNTIPLRFNVDTEIKVSDYLLKVKEETVTSFSNQALPFSEIIAAINPEREADSNPITNIMFTFQNMPKSVLELPELEIKSYNLNLKHAKFDLTMFAWEENNSIQLKLEYKKQLWHINTIVSFLSAYKYILKELLDKQDSCLADIEIYDNKIQKQLPPTIEDKDIIYPNKTILERFEDNVKQNPQKICLEESGQILTYAEVKNKVDLYAAFFMKKGIKPNDFVSIYMERSAEFIIVFLAIIKIGGCSVLLDRSLSEEKVETLLSTDGIKWLITEKMHDFEYAGTIITTDCIEAISMESLIFPRVDVKHFLYMIYTSGSTGVPKGVVVSQEQFLNYINFAEKTYVIPNVGDYVLLHSSISFDLTLTSIFLPLISNLTLLVQKENDISLLCENIRSKSKFRFLKLTPSHLDILHQSNTSWDQHISCLIVGGEQLYNHHIENIKNTDMVIYNEYGPTECAVACSVDEMRFPFTSQTISIGYPIPKVTLNVLDDCANRLPLGFPGELYIGGKSVSNAYYNRPGISAQSFVPDPFCGVASQRHYRSGDICRFRYDGKLECLGRIDDQVKLRGYRIETGEIVNAIKKHPRIKNAAVIVNKEQKQLVCYYVSDEIIDRDELYESLQGKLPHYMLPNFFVSLKEFPLTGNGKLDKRKLSQTKFETISDAHYYKPNTETEIALSQIFCEVLNIDEISTVGDFFRYGGHSLLAMKVISRIREKFSIQLELKEFFISPNILGLSKVIESKKAELNHNGIISYGKINPAVTSFQQRQLHLINQIDKNSYSYNIIGGIEFVGEVDIEGFQWAWKKVIERHELLRTQFIVKENNVYQYILDSVELPITISDLSTSDKSNELWERLIDKEVRRVFDLEKAPLFHIAFVKLQEHVYRMLLAIHHIIFDGWSEHVITRDLIEFYKAFEYKSYTPDLPALTIQYKDYAIWQQKAFEDGLFDKQMDYWVGKFKNKTKTLILPTDYSRGLEVKPEGLHYRFELQVDTVEKIKNFMSDQKATLFSVLLSCFGFMLQRYTGNDELVIGTPVAGRSDVVLEELLGYFVNIVAINLDGSNNPSFKEFLERNYNDIIDSMNNQEVPFEKVVEAIRPERSLNQNPLFQIMFALQNTPDVTMKLSKTTATPFLVESHTSKFDLEVTMEMVEGRLFCNFEYCSNLFKLDTIIRMSEIFEHTIINCMDYPEKKLSDILIIPKKQYQYLVEECCKEEKEFPLDKTFSQLFQKACHLYSSHLAAEDEYRQLTYSGLWEESVRVFDLITRQGFAPGEVLTILMDRSCAFLSAAIGTFHACGAYVPIDPVYPRDRIESIMKQIDSKIILTERKFAAIFCELEAFDKQVIFYEDLPESNDEALKKVLPSIASGKPRDLSYIIFTSGSTGTPKGAMLEQRGMMNHLYSKIKDLNIGFDKIIQNASQCFDISVWQNLGCLLTGGSVCIINQELASNPLEYFKCQAEKKATILELVPSFLRVTMELDLDMDLSAVRWVVVGGEILQTDLYNKWNKKFPDIGFVNAYGPSECSDDNTHYIIQKEVTSQLISVPIGHSIWNTKIYILDKNLNLLPEGVPGELCISGVSVGRGYFNNPLLTALNFVPDPYSNNPGARLYKTGDLCRFIGNGDIQFISRLDRQVKIRGFRIELGEIESKLMDMKEINDCVVWVFGEAANARLVAYYVLKEELEAYKIMEYLHSKLPSYMVPISYIKMESIPLSVNGKIDYKALPSPSEALDVKENYVIPNSTLEHEIAGIYNEILKLDQVSVTANFFDIGGNSLTATQVINKLNQKMKLSIPLRTIFEKPSIRELALTISKEDKNELEVIHFNKIDRNKKIPASYGQQQLLLLMKILPEDYSYNIYSALDLTGDLNLEALKNALEKIIARHEILRTVFVEEDGSFYQRIQNSIEVPMTIADNNNSWEDIVTTETKRCFDFQKGPLFQLTLLKTTDFHYKLMIVMHHIISDGWSMGLLVKEISYFYDSSNKLDVLEELKFQYADYTDWNRRVLESGVLKQQLGYWKNKFINDNNVLELPIDYPRKSGRSIVGNVLAFQLDSIPKEKVNSICTENGITIYMFLLGAFGILLQKYSRMSTVAVGSPVLGRKNLNLEELIGYFANTITIKLDGSDNPKFKEYLNRVKTDVLDSLNNQDLPFEKVVEAIHPVRNIEQNPLFQVMFSFQNIVMGDIDFPGVKVTEIPIHNQTAKFDLMFAVAETDHGYSVNIEYDNSIFKEDTISEMFYSYQKIIEEVCFNQELRLSEIDIIPAYTKKSLQNIWDGKRNEFPVDKTFSQLFRASVINNRNEICASEDGFKLTYSQVWDMSNKVASRLIASGVEVGDHVVLFMERSTKFLVSMLGIFHARAAYVPVDPYYPEYRVKQIFEKSKASFVITERTLYESIEKVIEGVQVFCIEDILENDLVFDYVQDRIDSGNKSDLAYIIFTSGSTGEPKGAMIEQKGMINHLYSKIEDLKISKDTIIQNASQCFDISVWQYLVCLLSGGNVHIVKQSVSMDPLLLFTTAQEVEATILEIVPSMLRAALETGKDLRATKLKYLVLTGEMLPNDICKGWYERYSYVPIINAYGPTECSDDVTHYQVSADIDSEPVPLPIGSTISNMTSYILDEYLMPVPIGLQGELYIGGTGVGRGYINNPRETALRFVPNPFTNMPGERLYKTGDLCRYLTNGQIQYLGRIDFQVKIRGFRIELTEIELAIRKHEDINDCVVVANMISNQNRLICYYVSPKKIEQSQLKNWLAKLLPSYMVPSIFVPIKKVGLTLNGKIDLKALPAPVIDFDEFDQEYCEPVTELEKRVAETMAEILEIPKVGLYNNFFDLGGHSLLVNKLEIKIENEFGYKMSFKDFFENPTVANVVTLISESMKHKELLYEKIDSMEESKVQELLERIDAGEDIEAILASINEKKL